MKTVALSKARSNLFKLRKDVVKNHEEVILTHKDGNTVMVSEEDWNLLLETLFILKDKKALVSLRRSLTSRKAGVKPKGISVEKAFSDLVH